MVKRTTDMRNRAVRSPLVLGLAGALVGTVAARVIRSLGEKRRTERIEWEPVEARTGYGYEPQGYGHGAGNGSRNGEAGLTDRVRAGADHLKDRAAGLKERALDLKDDAADRLDDARHMLHDRADAMREKLPGAEDVKRHAGSAYRFATEEQPILGGLLAIGAGLALGILLPVSEAEERALTPLREQAAQNLDALEQRVHQLAVKADEKIADFAGKAEDKLGHLADKADEKIAGSQPGGFPPGDGTGSER
jgi:hypothetical protein